MILGKPCKALATLALVISVSFVIPRQTQACGPFFTDAIFVYSKHPDFPLERFATGKMGILRSSYARSYLLAAYRNLIGSSLSVVETQALKSLWDDRLSYGLEFHDDEWVKKWTDARNRVSGVSAPPEIHAFRNREKPHEYETYLNCQQDAFENAEAVLNERIKQFGADSGAVRDWLAAQDTVFSNCGAGRQIPEPARADQDSLIRADRAYQIAAANFYAGSFDEAKQQFDSIAREHASPWHEMAAYLAARALLRKGSLATKAEEGRPTLTEAEDRLNTILKDKTASATHRASARLLNLARLRLHPEEKLHELAHLIVKRSATADFKQDVWDYTALLDKFVGDDEDTNKKAVPANLKTDDLTDWILTFQDDSTEASKHARDRWEKTAALPWLLALITKASTEEPNLDALLRAATVVDHNSPAFPSLAFHTVRLLIESGRTNEARDTLDKILPNDRVNLPASTLNLFLAQRMSLAQNLDVFLRDAQRKPAGFSDDADGRELPEDEKEISATTNGAQLFFDLDATNVFNKAMPVAIMKDAVRSTALEPNLRRSVTQAAFVRAALLEDRDIAAQAGIILSDLQPELREPLAAYESARTPDARQFAIVYLLLNFPGLRPYVAEGVGRTTPINEIDSYRDNWWCAEPPISTADSSPESEAAAGTKSRFKPFVVPAFLKPSEGLAAKQLATLEALGTGPNYLCKMAIEWVNKSPTDPRVPEALHLAVKSTRYGCTDKQTGRWSKAAFDLLHRRYPNTSWAKETKYWFKD